MTYFAPLNDKPNAMNTTIPANADLVKMSATFDFTLDKTYKVTLTKTIAGQSKPTYSVEVHDEQDLVRVDVVTTTIINHCNSHGAFTPPVNNS